MVIGGVPADWNEDAVKAAADNLTVQGHKAIASRCDVADDVEAMVGRTVEAFGRLDAAYNNAGVQNVLAETAETTREDYDRVMGINLRGEWSCMKFELQQMRKQGSGAIVNCSSLGEGARRRRGTRHLSRRQAWRAWQRRRELCGRPIHLGGWRFRHALIPVSFGVRTISMLFGNPGGS